MPTVVGVRYTGAPGRVPDAGKLGPDRAERGTPVPLEFELRVADGEPAAVGVHSTTHPISTVPAAGVGTLVRLDGPAPLDRDLSDGLTTTAHAVLARARSMGRA